MYARTVWRRDDSFGGDDYRTDGARKSIFPSAGYRCIQVTAKAMARSITDLFENPKLIKEATEELKNRLKKEQ